MRISPIHGIGTFATHAIDTGELLMLITGGIVIQTGTQQTEQIQLAADLYNQDSIVDNTYIGVRTTFGGLHRTINFVLLCNPPKWDAPHIS